MKGVLQLKNFCLRYESMEYLQICAGDFAHIVCQIAKTVVAVSKLHPVHVLLLPFAIQSLSIQSLR